MEAMIQLGMRAAIRDVQDWIEGNAWHNDGFELVLDAAPLKAYLLAMLITAGAFEDLHDGES